VALGVMSEFDVSPEIGDFDLHCRLLPNLGGSCPSSLRDHRIEFTIVQPPSKVHGLAADFHHHGVLCPTRSVAHVPTGFPARSAKGPRVGVITPALGQRTVLEVAGRLPDVVQDLCIVGEAP